MRSRSTEFLGDWLYEGYPRRPSSSTTHLLVRWCLETESSGAALSRVPSAARALGLLPSSDACVLLSQNAVQAPCDSDRVPHKFKAPNWGP